MRASIKFVVRKMPRLTLLLPVLFCQWVIVTFFCYSFVTANATGKTKQLSLCVQQPENLRSFIFVSTLDGKISALDATNNGQKQWSLDFSNGPMLSSNIHSRELNDNGQWVRLIPSLNGGLYKFDGENLETLPITTDQLLHSSFRYSNDLIFSGGKEVYSYGVHTNTGRILYECNVTGCTNNTDGEGYLKQDVLVIKRFQQTVRAIEARTGIERWNFSVGQHDLVLVPPEETYCPDKTNLLNIQVNAIIPEGLIWAVNESDPTQKLWQYKFDSPIVSIWRENANKDSTNQDSLEEINLFDTSQWIWGPEYSTSSPGLYVGMHQRQLYVLENLKLKNSLDSSRKHVQPITYPWKPYPAIGTAIIDTLSDKNDNYEVSVTLNEVQCTTALSVLYNSEYVNGNGFYLYPTNEITSSSTEQCNNTESTPNMGKPILTYTEKGDNEPIKTTWMLILFKWQGILAISIIILLNLILPLRYFNQNKVDNALIQPVIVETSTPLMETKSNDTINDGNGDNFISRYLTDFEPVDCLGKGGYGVVFEAKNKLDGCHYAIKRITLQNDEQSKNRVMREVRALAQLEHRNIVRYFNSWLEFPPCGWQEKHDEQWAAILNPSGCTTIITETETKADVRIDVPQTDSPSTENALNYNKLDKTEMTNDSVVFEHSSEKQHDAIYINDCSTDSSDVFSPNNITKDLLLNIDNSSHSESIVFEGSNNDLTEESNNDVTEESDNVTEKSDDDVQKTDNSAVKKEILDRRKSALSLDLIAKSNIRKSTKVFLYIQTQLCQRLSLKEWLRQESSVRDPFRVLSIFQQIVDAVEYVHLEGLIHRDLKPSNIFFAYDNSIKVGDFGLVTAMTVDRNGTRTPVTEKETVTSMDSVHTACVGTHLYMSPEQANGKSYNYKVDIYSLGIIFFELLTPFSTDMERAMVLTDLRKSIFPSYFAEKHIAEYDLLKMMLDTNPANRPTTKGIKTRPPLLNYQVANELFSS